MTVQGWRQAACALAMALVMGTARDATASTMTFDTAALAGGTFTLAFDLVDGDATPNTQVTIDAFDFGGGSVVGAPLHVGGASGDATSGIVLTDSSFLNTFLQDFTAGSFLRFDVVVAGGGTTVPDGVAFSILFNGLPIDTTDPSGANLMLFADAGSGGVLVTEFALASVPEPSTWLLVCLGGVVVGRSVRHRRR